MEYAGRIPAVKIFGQTSLSFKKLKASNDRYPENGGLPNGYLLYSRGLGQGMSRLMSSYVYKKMQRFILLFCVKKLWQRERRQKERTKGLFWEREAVFLMEF